MKTPALFLCLSALLLPAGCASVVKPSAPVSASASAPARRPMFSVSYPPAGGPVTVLTTTPPVVENVAPGLWRVTFPHPASATVSASPR